MLSCHLQAPSSEDEAASSSGEEEDAEAKAARTGKRSVSGRNPGAPKRKEAEKQSRSTDSKRRKKRPRDTDADGEGEEEARIASRLAMSDGPVAVNAHGSRSAAGEASAGKPQCVVCLSGLDCRAHCWMLEILAVHFSTVVVKTLRVSGGAFCSIWWHAA